MKMGLHTSKKQVLKREESTKINVEQDEKFYNEEIPTKSSSTKANNFAITLLVLTPILANIPVSNGLTCHRNSDIEWISKKSNKPVGCTPCRCPPGEEFSIPCGSKAYIGTPARCIPCPNGKYSDGFNSKPCVSCTVCSHRTVKQNCTHFRNSVCGDCKPGKYYENGLLSCLECGKCCHDGHDETHPSCTAVNLCKSRPSSCLNHNSNTPTLISSSVSTVITSDSLHKPTATPSDQQTTKPITTPIVNSRESKSSMISYHDEPQPKSTVSSSSRKIMANENDRVASPWIIALVVILCVVAIFLVIFGYLLLKKSKKSVVSCGDEARKCYKAVSQGTNVPHDDMAMEEMGEDQTLEQFINDKYQVVDELCKVLYHKKQGMFDFERVALEWKIEKGTINQIKNEIHVDGGSPVRILLGVLLSRRLCTTVRQLANSIKSINPDAYNILKPHLLISKIKRGKL